jgi:hypothetical protein
MELVFGEAAMQNSIQMLAHSTGQKFSSLRLGAEIY